MKKSLLVAALAAFTAANAAQANFYVEGNLGYSKISIDEVKDTGFAPSIAFGYKFDNFRLALDYTKYNTVKYSELETITYYDRDPNNASTTEVIGNEEAKIKVQSIGLSAAYDIDLNSEIKAYVGARIAQNNFKYTFDMEGTGYSDNENHSLSKFGYGAFIGSSYSITNNLLVTGTVEYNVLGQFEDGKISQYGAKIGLRYEF